MRSTITLPEDSDDLDYFLLLYGHTLAAWAFLEEALSENFQRLINVHPHLAQLLFFSGRSFNARADLYSAAITGAVGISDIRREAHKALLKRSRQFGAARNALAHGIPRHFTEQNEGGRLKHGQKLWELGGVSYRDMIAAFGNFQDLSKAANTLLVVTRTRRKSDELAEECLRQVRALPSQAFPRGDDRTPAEHA
jgi:hypothetical protein